MPVDLPVVEACEKCNQGFSLDEEYLACLLECVLCGTTDASLLRRIKIQRILVEKPKLAAMLFQSRRTSDDGDIIWMPDEMRVRSIVLKLARGHAAFELGLPQTEKPIRCLFTPLCTMRPTRRVEFERAGTGELRGWPEIGSRAFLRAVGAGPYADQAGPWVFVQEDRYRYAVDQCGGVLVRMVLGEYLACEVEWE